ncbi:MAG: hypothetical protein HN731_10190 [Rhodospirillaceae bacterium]|jgi:stalled ribosome alternative rescue factor ArfA|nr:hypothetical protein [Rhodospirillaceae bacterium]MBT5940434.1 hypothetical protein [Rhodospirillaceae bacterium]MBT7955553.1 hypothetical protein [Rhodospirillaceae bacterium]
MAKARKQQSRALKKKRNPYARALRENPLFRPKIEKDPTLYTRKTKHKKLND